MLNNVTCPIGCLLNILFHLKLHMHKLGSQAKIFREKKQQEIRAVSGRSEI